MAKEIAQQQATELTIPDELETLYSQSAGEGFEELTSRDFQIPFYTILQALSPQLRGTSKVKGAEEGDIFNTVSQEIIKPINGIQVIPSYYRYRWVEWVPRTIGGGFVGYHDSAKILDQTTLVVDPKDPGRRPVPTLPNGNHIVETAYYFVIRIKEDGAFERGIISMASTNLKVSRKWNSVRANFSAPIKGVMQIIPAWAQIWHLSTALETNKNNQSYYVWAPDLSNPAIVKNLELFNASKQFMKDIREDKVQIKEPSQEEESILEDIQHF